MTQFPDLENLLAQRLSQGRLAHVHRVRDTAVAMAERCGVDPEQAALAALGHDLAREMDGPALLAEARKRNLIVDPTEEAQPLLLHGAVAGALLRERGLITDETVLDAIRWHTTGRFGMTRLERLIWLADYIEPARSFPGVDDIRAAADKDPDRALLLALADTIGYVVRRGWLLHPFTVQARNWLLMQRQP